MIFDNQTCQLFSDPDDDTLTLNITNVPDGVTVTDAGGGSVLVNGTPTTPQPWFFAVEANDGNGGTKSVNIMLMCPDDPDGPDCSGLPASLSCDDLPLTVVVSGATSISVTFSGVPSDYSYSSPTSVISANVPGSGAGETATITATGPGGTCNHSIAITACGGATNEPLCFTNLNCPDTVDAESEILINIDDLKNGVGPYTVSHSGDLPSGTDVIVNGNNVSLSNPNSIIGTFDEMITITDSSSPAKSFTCVITFILSL